MMPSKMKPLSVALIILSLVFSCSVKAKHDVDLVYQVKADYGDSQGLTVDFAFESDKDGLIVLRYENNSWGDNDIFDCIGEFKVSPEPLNIEFDRDSSLITIKTKPNLKSHIQYSITQDFNEPLLNKHRYRPIIDKNYFHILGMRLFMVPEGIFETESSKVKIAISWGDLPSNAIFHSSFGPDKNLDIEVTQEDLYASFFVGGDFRKYEFDYEGYPVYFIIRDNWKVFDDTDIYEILKETVAFQNGFWQDLRKGMYSVSLLPTFEPWTEFSKANSIGGSGLPNSFISFASNNEGTTLKKMSWLYNHELLHKWIGRTIKNENEVEQYWFSEGFTDYYAYKLMLKNDKLNTEGFLDILNNEVVIPHYKDSVNTIPNSEITFESYWSNYAVYGKLPYRRGLLYAFFIDNQIRQRNDYEKSLDNVMLDLFQMALKDEGFRFNGKVFKQLLAGYLDGSSQSDFEKYIVNGQLIDFSGKLPEGLTIRYKSEIPVFTIKSAVDMGKLTRKLKL